VRKRRVGAFPRGNKSGWVPRPRVKKQVLDDSFEGQKNKCLFVTSVRRRRSENGGGSAEERSNSHAWDRGARNNRSTAAKGPFAQMREGKPSASLLSTRLRAKGKTVWPRLEGINLKRRMSDSNGRAGGGILQFYHQTASDRTRAQATATFSNSRAVINEGVVSLSSISRSSRQK